MPKRSFSVGTGSKGFIDGYIDDVRLGGKNNLGPPSVNCDIDKRGVAKRRLGYGDTGIDLSDSGKSAVPFYHERYDITLFALGTKIKYVDWGNSETVVDTALTMTDGTTTRMNQYRGDVYATNTTDGMRMIHFGRVNDSAANSGDSTIVVDQDMAARLVAFSHDTSSYKLYVNGTDEGTISSVNLNGTITLTGTLSQNYSDNVICFVTADISSGRPKAAKVVFWLNRMYALGVLEDSNTYGASTTIDDAPSLVYASKFATASTLEHVIDFNVDSTADIFPVGGHGRVVTAVAAKDFIYFFKEKGIYFASKADINTSNGSVSLSQLTDVQNNSLVYGAFNEDCAAYVGNDEVIFADRGRIIKIVVSTATGAATVFPDESFDIPVDNLLSNMDTTQTKMHVFYSAVQKRVLIQVSINNILLTLKYNNRIKAWEPPDTNKSFRNYFERNGVLYATDSIEDTIYEIGSDTGDNGFEFECVIATPEYETGDGLIDIDWKQCFVRGRQVITSNILLEMKVDGNVNGADGTRATIPGTSATISPEGSLGSVAVGNQVIGGTTVPVETGTFKDVYMLFPSVGSKCQIIMSSTGHFEWERLTVGDLPDDIFLSSK